MIDFQRDTIGNSHHLISNNKWRLISQQCKQVKTLPETIRFTLGGVKPMIDFSDQSMNSLSLQDVNRRHQVVSGSPVKLCNCSLLSFTIFYHFFLSVFNLYFVLKLYLYFSLPSSSSSSSSLLLYLWRVFHTSISWWVLTGVWVTASHLRSPRSFYVSWQISTML